MNMVQYNNYFINKDSVSLLEINEAGEHIVYLNCGKVIKVDEATFNALK